MGQVHKGRPSCDISSRHPQVNTRLLPAHFHAVRTEANRRGVPASHVIKELVASWYQRGTAAMPDALAPAESADSSSEPRRAGTSPPSGAPRTFVDTLREGACRAKGGAVIPTLARPAQNRIVTVKAIPSRMRQTPSAPVAGATSPRSGMFSD